jgi:hypothetical protein
MANPLHFYPDHLTAENQNKKNYFIQKKSEFSQILIKIHCLSSLKQKVSINLISHERLIQ